MQHYDSTQLAKLDKLFRNNLINSCTGYKSANLLGSISKAGVTNLAVFNSVFHLGSNPPLLGFILRPTTVARHTFSNMESTGVFTVNHIHRDFIAKAHQTSAKYQEEVSEFKEAGLEEEYLHQFEAPYVKESHIKIGCRYLNHYSIVENETILVVAAIEQLFFPEKVMLEDGWLNLEVAGTVAINGLDGYALPSLLDRFQYARPGEETKSLTPLKNKIQK